MADVVALACFGFEDALPKQVRSALLMAGYIRIIGIDRIIAANAHRRETRQHKCGNDEKGLKRAGEPSHRESPASATPN